MTKRERNDKYRSIYKYYLGENMLYSNLFICNKLMNTGSESESSIFKRFPEFKTLLPPNWDEGDVLNIEKKYWKERKGKKVSTERVNALRACILEFCIEMTN